MAVFSTLRQQLFRLMQQSVTLLQGTRLVPNVSERFSLLIPGKVSLDRLDEFLHKSELLDSFLEEKVPLIHVANHAAAVESSDEIGFKDASFSWSLDEEEDTGYATPSSRVFRLRVEGELIFKRNAINMIIGPT